LSDAEQVNPGLTERPEAESRPVRPQLADCLISSNIGCFQPSQCFPITRNGRSELQRPRFARYKPATWAEDVDRPVDSRLADSRSPKSRMNLNTVND